MRCNHGILFPNLDESRAACVGQFRVLEVKPGGTVGLLEIGDASLDEVLDR